MAYQTPQIAKDLRRLRGEIELAVRGFDRFHRYNSGTVLRDQVRKVQRLIVRYWHDVNDRQRWVDQLRHEIDVLKEDLQAAKDVSAFKHGFRQFENLYRQAEAIGRQAGGISRQHKHPRGQNAQGTPVAQRARKLSTHATPVGVNP